MKKIQYYGQEHAQATIRLMKDISLNPERYNREGVTLPHGIIVIGSPGTGKTLFARKLAEELDKELIVVRPSSDMLSSEITEAFKKARESDKYIILLDELVMMINRDEKTEGLLLAELDGTLNTIVVATTSTGEGDLRSYHEALIRPGRFDVRICLTLPSYDDRYTFAKENGLNVGENELKYFADITVNSSYAQLKTLINHIKMHSIYNGVKIDFELIKRQRDNIASFVTDNSEPLDYQIKRAIAIHELGHAVIGVKFNYELTSISISSEYSEGVTSFVSRPDYCLNDTLERITRCLGGIASEKVMSGTISSGGSADFDVARSHIGFVFQSFFINNKSRYSEPWLEQRSAFELDREYKLYNKILRKCEKNAVSIVSSFKDIILKYVDILVEKNWLIGDDLDNFIKEVSERKIKIKKIKI